MIKIKAAGRVCLFGDHQDYLGLPVIACAIDRHIHMEAVPNGSKLFKIKFLDLKETRNISIPYNFENYDPKDTFLAVLKVLERHNCIADRGYDISIKGNIPINAGLSSSSALILIWIGFLVKAFGNEELNNQERLAQIAFEAEVLERDGPGGKMDQYSIALGNIIYLETDKNARYKTYQKKLPGLIIGESGIPKDTLGLLADRRSLAVEALEFLEDSLPNFDMKKVTEATLGDYIKILAKPLRPYFNAAVQNYLITKQALLEFEKPLLDIVKIGKLMNAHHSVLKNDLKITVPKIDNMIDTVLKHGAYGAKIVGSGGGGCIVAFVPEEKEELIVNELKNIGAFDAYKVAVAKGITL